MDASRNQLHIQSDVPLAPYTTIGLGGVSRCFTACRTVEQVREALRYVREEALPLQVLGGGSNIIFADEGFPGLVLKVELPGLAFREEGDWVEVTAGAGLDWDEFVQACIERDLAGLECLSGIPGSVGATPIQNVGAYGQEVSDTLVSLQALDRHSLEVAEFSGEQCRFAYRQSRFKQEDRDAYVILEVTFRLRPFGRPTLHYPELERYVREQVSLDALERGRPALEGVRQAVLSLRRKKSMLVNPNDADARSVGSFFLNPILSPAGFQRLQRLWEERGGETPIPTFPAKEGIKVPAAWLVERAGFSKGYRRGGAGISSKHALALINCGGTTRELLDLAAEIQFGVQACFGLYLEIEPVVVPS
jgi:UDP-N-acetylmuramate dehydrogenase